MPLGITTTKTATFFVYFYIAVFNINSGLRNTAQVMYINCVKLCIRSQSLKICKRQYWLAVRALGQSRFRFTAMYLNPNIPWTHEVWRTVSLVTKFRCTSQILQPSYSSNLIVMCLPWSWMSNMDYTRTRGRAAQAEWRRLCSDAALKVKYRPRCEHSSP